MTQFTIQYNIFFFFYQGTKKHRAIPSAQILSSMIKTMTIQTTCLLIANCHFIKCPGIQSMMSHLLTLTTGVNV